MSSSLPVKVSNVVWGRFARRCAVCEMVLERSLEDGSSATIGKIAHIVGEKPGSARYDAEDLTEAQRNSPDNLMLLCGTHHDEVDNYREENSVEKLRKIRKEFLGKVDSAFVEELHRVGFPELDVTISYLLEGSSTQYEGTLTLITPREKIDKNQLSKEAEDLLRLGLIREKQLEEYLNKNLDITFAPRLRNIMVEMYNQLKSEGLSPDEIFYEMLNFASGNDTDFLRRAAALAVVAYFFNVCDIFEK